MLSKIMYTSEYIEDLYRQTGNDPALLERVIYAFGLLEAIRRVELPFCFKGGTALMILLDSPKRLSTDIDIIVEPGVDIDEYIRKAGEIFPFMDVEEQIRVGKNDIEKRHFKFKYHSPRTGENVTILLDVLIENVQYGKTILKPISNSLLLNEGEAMQVRMPNVNSILGDKLTAFAPRTTGIPFGINKEMEIIKQLFDCGCLFDVMTDYGEVRDSYNRIVRAEMAYRGIVCPVEDILKDTIKACLCIASRGIPNENDYEYFKDGISRVRSHVIGSRFGGEVAGAYAGRVLYLATAMLMGQGTLIKIYDGTDYLSMVPDIEKPKRFTYMRLADPVSYGYFMEAVRLLKI